MSVHYVLALKHAFCLLFGLQRDRNSGCIGANVSVGRRASASTRDGGSDLPKPAWMAKAVPTVAASVRTAGLRALRLDRMGMLALEVARNAYSSGEVEGRKQDGVLTFRGRWGRR